MFVEIIIMIIIKVSVQRKLLSGGTIPSAYIIMIIIDNFCIALFSGVPKLTALYNILQHF